MGDNKKHLLTFTFKTNYENKEIKSDKQKSSEIYDELKAYEYISLERFNYSSNLKNNLLCLIQMQNIIFYLILLFKIKKVKDILDKSDEKNTREELNYKTKH